MPARRKYNYKYTNKYRKRNAATRRVKKVFKLTVLSVVGLLLFSVAFYLYSITLIIKRPFANASSAVDYNVESYNSTKPFNILFIELEDKEDAYSNVSSLHIYHINPLKNKGLVFEIPVNINLEYSKRLGEGELTKLYSMGNFGDENRGVETVTNFLEKQLAINIDGYVVYDSSLPAKLSDINISISKQGLPASIKYTTLLKIPRLFDLCRYDVFSDLSSVEALKLLTDTKVLAGGDFEFILLSKEQISNPQEFDNLWQERTATSYVKSPRVTAIVVNSTSSKGLAGWGARVIKNSGGVVIEVANQKEELKQSAMYKNIPDNDYSSFLTSYFSIDKVLSSNEYTEDTFLAKRADILIVLGLDVAGKL
jgi:hypothetical protein